MTRRLTTKWSGPANSAAVAYPRGFAARRWFTCIVGPSDRMHKDVLRWVWVLVALPAGGIIGFFGGYYLSLGILLLQGQGTSHNDMFTVVFSGMIGAPVGAALLPLVAWFATRKRTK